MLNISEGRIAVKIVRKCIESRLIETDFDLDEFDLTSSFEEKRGAFVTIRLDGDLRGCIGRPYPEQKLKEALCASATGAAFEDPRFSELTEEEFERCIIELTILTEPESIEKDGRDLLDEIVVGRDGLIISSGVHRGLLLPQVAVEQSWDKTDFLSETSMKAGLMPDAWLDSGTEVQKFQGQIFIEKEPGGKIKELDINESC